MILTGTPIQFQSTLPARGATGQNDRAAQHQHISIHAPRTGSDQTRKPTNGAAKISIHAPRTGSDDSPHRRACPCVRISIHAPRTGSDGVGGGHGVVPPKFQSTLPARGATARGADGREPPQHFNPRSPHGERPIFSPFAGKISNFNPRSPHGERRRRGKPKPPTPKFQSTLPARGATTSPISSEKLTTYFNPRSPHGERRRNAVFSAILQNFNPRSPHGERLDIDNKLQVAFTFQSTLPARGATKKEPDVDIDIPISIHAPRTGSDH